METVTALERDVSERSTPDEDDRVWTGVSLMLDQYVQLRGDDRVLLLYGRDAREPASWVAAELQARQVPVTFIDLDMVTPANISQFGERLARASLTADRIESRLVVLTIERDVITPSAWIRQALSALPMDKLDMFRTIMAGREFFEQGVTVPPYVLNRINAGLLNALRSTQHVKITTSSGTELEVTLDPTQYRWVSNRGIPRQGAFVFLPAGEVATFPASISGLLVADGAFNTTAFTKLDARLSNHPVEIEIRDGRLVSYRCASASVEKLIERIMRLPNADRVGELGFGTNIGVTEFIPMNAHLNERHPGLHIGFGQNTQGSHALYECDVHLDFVASDCIIELDGHSPLKSADFAFLTGEHPTIEAGVFDEDLDGDCCGLFAAHSAAQCQ